jgi:hypothetical protein
MKWQLDAEHHIDEMVLPAGTIIGDGTDHPFRAVADDHKINRKRGDHLPPSTQMTPLDDEARKLFKSTYGEDATEFDPMKAIPLTGAQGAPKVQGVGAPRPSPTALTTPTRVAETLSPPADPVGLVEPAKPFIPTHDPKKDVPSK